MSQKHFCGTCGGDYDSQAKYLAHVCNQTGHKPATFEHLDATSDGQFSLQSAKALERGESKKKK